MQAEIPYDPTAVLALIDSIEEALDRLRRLLLRQPDKLDPSDPSNKLADGKLTPQGVEVCYRLFDQGMTRYRVSRAMNISFGAASYREGRWRKEGGKDRKRRPLD